MLSRALRLRAEHDFSVTHTHESGRSGVKGRDWLEMKDVSRRELAFNYMSS